MAIAHVHWCMNSVARRQNPIFFFFTNIIRTLKNGVKDNIFLWNAHNLWKLLFSQSKFNKDFSFHSCVFFRPAGALFNPILSCKWGRASKKDEAYGAKNGLFAWVGSYQDNLHNDMLSKSSPRFSVEEEAKPIFLGCYHGYLHSVWNWPQKVAF